MLAKKLLVRAGSRVGVIGAPPTIDLVLPPEAHPANRGPADILLAYVKNAAAVAGALAKARARLADGGVLWVAYPKARQLGTDLDRDVLARALQAEGLEPVTQIAVDEVWSALRVKRDAALSAARKARGGIGAKKKAPAKKSATKPATKPATKKKAAAKKAGAKKKTGAKKASSTRRRAGR